MSVALIIGLAVVGLILIIAATNRSGPRITTIETKHERKDEEEDAA